MKKYFNFRNVFLVTILFSAIGFLLTFIVISTLMIDTPNFPEKYTIIKIDSTKLAFIKVIKPAIITNNNFTIIKSNTDTYFNNNPIFLFWIILILIMMTISSGSVPFFLRQILLLKKKFNVNHKVIYSSISFVIIVYILIYIFHHISGYYRPDLLIADFKILFKNSWAISFVIFGTLLFILPIVTVIFLIAPIALNLEIKSKNNLLIDIENYNYLHDVLMKSLQVLTIIIIFSVLTSSGLRMAIKSQIICDEQEFNLFPKEFSYIYGIFFSLILAIIFVPTYAQLRQLAANLLCRQKDENQPIDDKLLVNLYENKSIIENIKLVTAIMLPTIASILPESLRIF